MQSEAFKKEIELIMSGKKHLSFSAIKSFMQSPKHFYVYKTDKDSTKAMNEGQIFHIACLEPEKFKSKFWVLDDSEKCSELIKGGAKQPRSTNLYKDWLLAECAKNEGKEMLSKEDFDTFMAMGNYLNECSATSELMSGLINKESEFEFTHDNFLIKGKIDGEGIDYLIDLKKVADASFKKVRWIIEDMMYDMQGAIYCQAKGKLKYYLIFIDNSCNITVVKLSQASLEKGFNKFKCGLAEFYRCAEEDLFNSSYEFFNGGFIEV